MPNRDPVISSLFPESDLIMTTSGVAATVGAEGVIIPTTTHSDLTPPTVTIHHKVPICALVIGDVSTTILVADTELTVTSVYSEERIG